MGVIEQLAGGRVRAERERLFGGRIVAVP